MLILEEVEIDKIDFLPSIDYKIDFLPSLSCFFFVALPLKLISFSSFSNRRSNEIKNTEYDRQKFCLQRVNEIWVKNDFLTILH